ncbi:AAA family ATPase [Shewanella algae]|uniref:AAA family ATPase n=1 Tax=Shewanella algae TaxID=38313 RepID=UPI003B685A63
MFIRSLSVEEGFFNSLNLKFSKGLNVLIGGRGVGKTSVIELLRFGLGAKALVGSSLTESSSHAMSILQSSGRVSIELEDLNGNVINVSRAANDKYPFTSDFSNWQSPIIFSQKEIETIGLSDSGRVSLVDSFLPELAGEYSKVYTLQNEINFLAEQYFNLSKEIVDLTDKTTNLKVLLERESSLQLKHENILATNSNVEKSKVEVDRLQNLISSYSVDVQNLKYIQEEIGKRISIVSELSSERSALVMPPLISNSSLNHADMIQNKINAGTKLLANALEMYIGVQELLKENLASIDNERAGVENKARKNRIEIDNFLTGAGSLLSELGRVREEIAQLKNIENIIAQKKSKINELYERIQSKITEMYAVKNEIFSKRNSVVSYLNIALNPNIKVDISNFSNLIDYNHKLESVLRGSGLKYKELVPVICYRISPQWLFYYVHNNSLSEEFSNMIGVPVDRGARLLGYLKEVSLVDLLACQPEDSVEFMLFDHGQYKPIDELSIGQRCTVSLSIILENITRVLIVDQPEDHLDNEFIAKTLINSIKSRASNAQTILSSHNANIPVLGNAANVVSLESNGRRGYVKVSGPVDSPEIKTSIESIMEGGKEAFSLRSNFYKR